MSTYIEVLKRTELLGQQFTVYGTAEEPLFLAKEIAEVIQYSNNRAMLQSVDESEKGVRIVYTPGGEQEMWFLTEDGLYEILMQSRKPIAKQFKKGVKQILKEIRTKGGYIAASVDDTPEQIMARALVIAQQTLSKRDEMIKQLQADNELKDSTIAEQSNQLKISAPKVKFYDECLHSVNTMTTTQVAKELGMHAEILNKKLRDAGPIYRQSNQWILHTPYSSWGLHSTRTQTFTRSDCSIGTSIYTVWTQKGRRLIHALHENNYNLKTAIKSIKESSKI